MPRPLKQRNIACARCFRLKRKCDHAKPSCSECRRKGAECLPARSRKTGDNITIPLEYLRQLEQRFAELDARSTAQPTNTRDVGIQTDFDELSRNDPRQLLAEPDITNDTENDSSLMLFSELQYQGTKSRRTPPSHYAPDAFSLLTESSFDLPWIDMTPLYSFAGDDSSWLKEMYANTYFSVTHREWPFLDEPTWRSWHTDAILDGQDEWRSFFLRMVYAIGASLSSTLQRDPSHSARSKEFYTSAMRYYPHVVGHSSMVLQIQASLLMILYALHSPSCEEITTSVASILPFCAAAMTEIRKHASLCRENGSATEADEILSEKMFISCYMLNEIIVSGWDRPVSAAYRVVDDDMCSLGDTLRPALDINPALSHLFRLRKIQANIRRSRETWPCNSLTIDDKSHRSSFKSALDNWRRDIPQNAVANVQCGYLHPIWMQKLYDYSLLILVEGRRDFNDMDGTEDILAAILDVCHNFRMLQNEGHVMCYTWSALVFQFRAGIMLLYIIRTTNWSDSQNQQQIRQTTLEAISTCATNLTGFVDRWVDAMPYMNVFNFLRQKATRDLDTSGPEYSNAPILLEEAEFYLEQLKKSYLHRAVLDMIEDMMYGGSIQQELLADDMMEPI